MGLREKQKKKAIPGDFPCIPVVKNLLANLGDSNFQPWSVKIPHASKQLSLCATTIEPVLWCPGTTAAKPTCHND